MKNLKVQKLKKNLEAINILKNENRSFLQNNRLNAFYETNDQSQNPIGHYNSFGTANNSLVYMGPRGGVFYKNLSGGKTYLNAEQIANQITYID